MLEFSEYGFAVNEHDEKQIVVLMDELYNKMNFSERAQASFDTILKCLKKYKGDETYTMCRNSYRNILKYDKNTPEFKKMVHIIKLSKFHDEFKKNWLRAVRDAQMENNSHAE